MRSSSLPVVASSVGGLPDSVIPGRTGVLVPVGDAVSAAKAMERLWCDSELLATLSRGARAFVLAERDEVVIRERYLRLLEAVSASWKKGETT